MYRKSVRRRRIVVLLLVVVSVALLTAHFGENASGPLHTLQRGFMEVLAPLQEGTSRALKPVHDLFRWMGDITQAKSENERLKKEVSSLRRELARNTTAQRDNQELRKLLKLGSSPTLTLSHGYVTGRVIARSPTVWYSTITIDKGSSSGVRTDQPVLSGDGLVGRITQTSPHAAQVTLITDHSSGVSAQVVPGGAVGLVQPAVGNPDDLLLSYVKKGKRVRRGDMVVTAGWRSSKLESLFPRGIPLGRITKVSPSELDIYQRAHLKPFAELSLFDVVQVITRKRQKAVQQVERLGS